MKKTTLAMSALALSLGLALSPLSATAAETSSSAMTAQQMPSLAPMLEKVMPSVVSINVEGSTTVNTPRMPRNFQQFFGDNSPFCQDGSPFQSSPFCQGGGAPAGGGQQQGGWGQPQQPQGGNQFSGGAQSRPQQSAPAAPSNEPPMDFDDDIPF